MWWRRGTTGAWRTLPLPFWTPASHGNLAFWESNDTAFGHIAASGKTTLEFRISFRARNHSGEYSGSFAFGSSSCDGGHEMIGFGAAEFYYQP